MNCKTDDTIDESEEICPRNVEIGLETLTANSVTIKWLETQGFASNYEYGEKGFTLGTGIKGKTSDESVTLENLKPDTIYDFYLQSICTAEITGEFTPNPYTFTTLTCYELNTDNLGFIGYVGNGDFNAFWIPDRNADEWQVAMLLSGTDNPVEAQIYTIESNVNRFDFPDIKPFVEYTFFVRGKCGDTFGDWETKNINTGDENLTSPCIANTTIVNNDGYDITFYLANQTNYIVEIVEELEEKGSGLVFERDNNSSFNINKQTFHNEYAEYVKAATNYDVFVRVECGSSFSEYTKVLSFKSPVNNAAFLTEGVVNGEDLQLSWLRNYGFNNSYCQLYDEVVYEIEYGPQGFTEGEGILIDTEGVPNGGDYGYNLPLIALAPGVTYEFSIRTIVNLNSVGEWNSSHCNNSGIGRLVFTAP